MKTALALAALILTSGMSYASSSVDLRLTGGSLEGPLNANRSEDESGFGGNLRALSEITPDYWAYGSIMAMPGDTIRYKDARLGLSFIPQARVAFGAGIEFVHLSLTQEFSDAERGRTGGGVSPNLRFLAKVSERFDLEVKASGLFLSQGNGFDVELGGAIRMTESISAVLHAHYLSVDFQGRDGSFRIPYLGSGIRFSF